MKKLRYFLLFACSLSHAIAYAENGEVQTTTDSLPKNWTKVLGVGLNYNQTSLTNPPAGYGQNMIGGNVQANFSLSYDHKRNFWLNSLNWNFGLLRFGSGPLELGSSQKIPFQKTLDQFQASSMLGYRISKDSALSLLAGFEAMTQATPSYVDPEGKIGGVFIKDIRDSGTNPLLAKFLAPASVLAYVGIGYRPSPQLFIGYSPATYKGILVLDDAAASLVGKTDAQGLPTATVHGNPVEIVNGKPVFKKSFNQFGSYLLATYKDRYFKNKVSYGSKLQLYSNYISHPERLDVYWQNTLDLSIVKGLSLSYAFDLFYDHDVLVLISDKNVPGGFSGYGQRVAMRRQLMLRYQIMF